MKQKNANPFVMKAKDLNTTMKLKNVKVFVKKIKFGMKRIKNVPAQKDTNLMKIINVK